MKGSQWDSHITDLIRCLVLVCFQAHILYDKSEAKR